MTRTGRNLRRETSGVSSLRCSLFFLLFFDSMSVLLSLHVKGIRKRGRLRTAPVLVVCGVSPFCSSCCDAAGHSLCTICTF